MERNVTHKLPADIERESMRIIAAELAQLGIVLSPETAAVVKRVIHTTADFDYAQNLRFTDHAVERAAEAFWAGAVVVTDTNMAKSGVSRAALSKLGSGVYCFMADPDVALEAKAHTHHRPGGVYGKSGAGAPWGGAGCGQRAHRPAENL